MTAPRRPNRATEADAADVAALTGEVFSRHETVEDVARELGGPGGLVVREAGRLLAAAGFAEHHGGLWLRRVAVHPGVRRQGLAASLARAAEDVARDRGYDELRVGVRIPLVAVAEFWRGLGFRDIAQHDHWLELARPLPVHLDVPTPEAMHDLGRRLAAVLRAGDLVVLTGDLGAGKTTLTRGVGVGLAVRGQVTSPTFVLARVHPPTDGGPALVHVDAYRLATFAEVDDLDLDASMDESVTIVEWGEGKVEDLADSRLEVVLRRARDAVDEHRVVTVRGLGARWSAGDLRPLRASLRA